MGRYTIIADIGQYLTDVLAEGLIPDLLADKNEIGLCCPEEKGDLTVGIYLYDIQENEAFRVSGMVNHSFQAQSYPPTFLSLYYMITVWSPSDIRFRAIQEHRILGRIIQLLKDKNLWEAAEFGNDDVPNIRVEYLEMTPEEKAKAWNSTALPYRTSLFFKIGPVSLDSAKTRAIHRVMDMDIQVKEDEGRHGKNTDYLERAGGGEAV